jgi:aspartate aminotransferase
MHVANRAKRLKPSITLAITAKANELRAQGRDVIAFGAGEPDFDTPPHVREAAKKAIDAGFTRYTPASGTPELKDAIVEKFRRDNGADYKRENIIVSCGGKHSLHVLFQALLDPGDEAIIPAPYWVSYPPMVELAGGKPVIAPTDESTGFRVTVDQLAKLATPSTRILVLNSPSNPTGAAYSEPELRALCDFCLAHGITVVSDEIYESIVYGGFKFVSVASLGPQYRENCVIVNGVSKSHAMTGWRIGYTAGPANVIAAMGRLQDQSTSNPSSISQKAAVAALTGPQDFLKEWVAAFDERRRYAVAALNAIEGVRCTDPEGAFYVFPHVMALYGKKAGDRTIATAEDLCDYLLDTAGTALVPGTDFGAPDNIRLSYAVSLAHVKDGLRRMTEAIAKLR